MKVFIYKWMKSRILFIAIQRKIREQSSAHSDGCLHFKSAMEQICLQLISVFNNLRARARNNESLVSTVLYTTVWAII